MEKLRNFHLGFLFLLFLCQQVQSSCICEERYKEEIKAEIKAEVMAEVKAEFQGDMKALEFKVNQCQEISQESNLKIENHADKFVKFQEDLSKNAQGISEQQIGSNKLATKVEHLNKLSKLLKIKSCSHLVQNGIEESDEFHLDLIEGQKPVKALCNLPKGETVLGQKNTLVVEHCSGSGCYEKDITYDASEEEMVALLESSSTCRQEIAINCKSSPLEVSTFL